MDAGVSGIYTVRGLDCKRACGTDCPMHLPRGAALTQQGLDEAEQPEYTTSLSVDDRFIRDRRGRLVRIAPDHMIDIPWLGPIRDCFAEYTSWELLLNGRPYIAISTEHQSPQIPFDFRGVIQSGGES